MKTRLSFFCILVLLFLTRCTEEFHTPSDDDEFCSQNSDTLSNDLFILAGHYEFEDCIIALFAEQLESGEWIHFTATKKWICPGPDDFQFSFSYQTGWLHIKSPFQFHNEDFSAWEPTQSCNNNGSWANFRVFCEEDSWILQAQFDPDFLECLFEIEDGFFFRFSFFQ